jgi:hypothetical protein
LLKLYASCTDAGVTGNPWAMPYENRKTLWVCRGRQPSMDKACRRKIEMTPGAQSRDDTRVGGGHDERDLDCIPAVRLSSDLIASADRD